MVCEIILNAYLISLHFNIADVSCRQVWTGGRTFVPGGSNRNDWQWHYTSDSSGLTVPFTYLKWVNGQPNNWRGQQYYIALNSNQELNFKDVGLIIEPGFCFLCECP